MAERIHDLPGVTLVATDFSPRFVELTAARGVDARQADICYLPFEDDAFDVVYAGWMLYHVRDLERALNEIRRVLRPGGTFVAVTNGNDHLADLVREAGGTPVRTQFSSETGESVLRRRFADVRRHDLETRAVFPDHAQRAGLPRLDRRRPGAAGVRGRARVRRCGHGLRGALTVPRG